MQNSKANYKSFYWNALEKFGIQALQFIIGITLARILSPSDYGLVGILLVFIAVSQIFVDSGFTKALIQRNDKSEKDLSTAFTFNLAISITFYVILWFTAPIIASFYNEEVLINLLRSLALILVINAFFSIPNTILTIDLEFKKIALINFVAVLISGSLAIFMAYSGYGVWSLVMQYLLRAVILLIFFTIASKWSFKLYFSKRSFKLLFSFGSNLLASSLLNVVVDKFSSLFIAKTISTQDLGFYTRGIQFPDIAIGTLGSVLDTVLLPTLSKTKELTVLRFQIDKMVRLLSLVTMPVVVLLAILAEPIIVLLLTDKWLPVVPIMQFFCVSRFFTNLISVNTNVLYVLNKANLVLKQHYLKIAIRVGFILLALPYGIIYIAFAEMLSAIAHLIINTHYPGKYIKFGFKAQLNILLPHIAIGSFLFLVLFFFNTLFDNPIYKLLFIPFSGIMSYILLIFMICKKDYYLLKEIVLSFKNK